MKHIIVVLACVLSIGGGCCSAVAQEARQNLYRCEGCEAIHEHSFDDLTWHTTISPEDEPGEPFVLEGTVYRADGSTPAAGVIVYAYHTDHKGVYPTRGDEEGWAQRHGYLRGWTKTNEDGRYRFTTIRPAMYPSRTTPAHVHMTVKEPGKKEYWIEAVVFEGDPYLDEDHLGGDDPRGGSGLIALTQEDGVWRGRRDIVLELHPK